MPYTLGPFAESRPCPYRKDHFLTVLETPNTLPPSPALAAFFFIKAVLDAAAALLHQLIHFNNRQHHGQHNQQH